MAKKKEAQIIGEKSARKSIEELNETLVENFVNLQRVMTNLAERFDNLSANISNLLNLFEISAKTFMERPEIKDAEKDQEFLEKLNTLLDQNKTIAKGLTLMEEKIRERVYGQKQETPDSYLTGVMPPQQDKLKKLPRL